ncbi:Protein of unknown function [Paraburkholderia tuberum]|uniref:DUF3563 domain-containing protein n=1 Tax=Paraburkholderia tuberum TaxID=157910 RepID=A0A1H1G0Q2_9BURK|nr:Protein of unknown function [Paraburkholderia tuberum]
MNPNKIRNCIAPLQCTIPKRNAHHAGISLFRLYLRAIMRVNPFTGNPRCQITGDSICSLENIMFAFILEKLSTWFETAERSRREAYLASSSDIVQLEQRIRSLETNGYSL